MDTQKGHEDAEYEVALQRAESEGWRCQSCDDIAPPDDAGDQNLAEKE